MTAFGGMIFRLPQDSLAGTTYQIFNAQRESWVANATGTALASGLSLSVLGDLLIDPGGLLNAPGNTLSVYGN